MKDKISLSCAIEGAKSGVYFLPQKIAEKIIQEVNGVEKTDNFGLLFTCCSDDERMEKILSILQDNNVGIYSWKNRSVLNRKNRDGVVIWRELEFDDQDLDDLEYLELGGADVRLPLDDHFYGATGPRTGLASKVKPSFQLGRDFFDWGCILAGSKGKTLLENSDLQGFRFEELELRGKKAKDEKFRTWQLVNDFDAPPIADDYVVDGGEITASYPQDGSCLPNTPWFPCVYRYDRKILENLKPDFFLSREAFGNDGRVRFRKAIISQKFRQFCINQKWKIICSPVLLV